MSGTEISINQLFEQEEDYAVSEPEYAGITASWLREAITSRAIIALQNAPKKHAAARKIQAIFRGWTTRKGISIQQTSAIKIQKTWRGFLGRLRYFRILEITLHNRIEEHYHQSATLIQSTYRGFYSRKHIHDHVALKKLQLQASKDLVLCIAVKARKLLKNQQIPGLYSLRNSSCHPRVEHFLATLQIMRYNEETRKAYDDKVVELKKAFEKAEQSKEGIEVPFGAKCSDEVLGRRSVLKDECLETLLCKEGTMHESQQRKSCTSTK